MIGYEAANREFNSIHIRALEKVFGIDREELGWRLMKDAFDVPASALHHYARIYVPSCSLHHSRMLHGERNVFPHGY